MKDVDLLVICGIPRSGTSFLVDVLGMYGKPAGIFSMRRYDRKHPWNPDEPGAVAVLYNVLGKESGAVELLYTYWKNNLGQPYETIVYKQPQALFSIPIKVEGRKVMHIVCGNRPKESWLRSALAHPDTQKNVIVGNMRAWVKDNWRQGWDVPKEIEARLSYFYDVCVKRISEVVKRNDTIFFDWQRPRRSMERIFGEIFNRSIEEIVNEHWRVRFR